MTSKQNLVTYLNDHLAGSTLLIDVLEDLQRSQPGTEVSSFVTELRSEVLTDRRTLEELMRRAEIEKRSHRTAMAWLIAKLSRMKLRLDGGKHGPLHLLEALELVEIGIEGKKELWRSLDAIPEDQTPFPGLDFEYMIQRAENQHHGVETVRVEAAKTALVADSA